MTEVQRKRKLAEERAEESKPVWESFAHAFIQRHKVSPIRDALANIAIRQAIEVLGAQDAPKVLVHYLKSNDPFVVRNMHSLSIFKQQMNRFYVEWQQSRNGIDPAQNMPISRQVVRDTLSGLHHNLHLKDYSAGVDANGRLID